MADHKGLLAPGTTLGPYRIVRLKGKGGMGEVYEASEDRLGRRVAIKVISSDQLLNPANLERFETEGRALAKLSHPNVVSVYSFDYYMGAPYLALEYVEGHSLSTLLKERVFSVNEALPLFRQLLSGTLAFHKHGILHRDIKPHNIIYQPDSGTVKILDFGVAKMFDEEKQEITGAGVVVGTPKFLSPEVADGGAATVQSDIWALGITFYCMLVGQTPFEGKDYRDVVRKIRTKPVRFPMILSFSLPKRIQRLILKMTEKDLKRRYSSIEKIISDLDRYMQEILRTSGANPFKENGKAGFRRVENGEKILKALSKSGYDSVQAKIILSEAAREQAALNVSAGVHEENPEGGIFITQQAVDRAIATLKKNEMRAVQGGNPVRATPSLHLSQASLKSSDLSSPSMHVRFPLKRYLTIGLISAFVAALLISLIVLKFQFQDRSARGSKQMTSSDTVAVPSQESGTTAHSQRGETVISPPEPREVNSPSAVAKVPSSPKAPSSIPPSPVLNNRKAFLTLEIAGGGGRPVQLKAPPELSWRGVGNEFVIEIARDTRFSDLVQSFRVRGTTFVWRENIEPGVFHWRVKAIGTDGVESAYSSVAQLTLLLPAPSIQKEFLTTFPSRSPSSLYEKKLNWSQVPLSSGYLYYIAKDRSFRKILASGRTKTTHRSFQLGEGTYYFKVATVDGRGQVAGSFAESTVRVRVAAVSPKPKVAKPKIPANRPKVQELLISTPNPMAPLSGVELGSQSSPDSPLAFYWGDVGHADSYLVEFSMNKTFSSVFLTEKVTQNKMVLTRPLPYGTVYWRVRAQKGERSSKWSDAQSLVVPVGR